MAALSSKGVSKLILHRVAMRCSLHLYRTWTYHILRAGQLHQSDVQGQNAPMDYFARQEMTPEIAHIYVDRIQNVIIWMQSDLSHHRLCTVFFFCVNLTFGQP